MLISWILVSRRILQYAPRILCLQEICAAIFSWERSRRYCGSLAHLFSASMSYSLTLAFACLGDTAFLRGTSCLHWAVKGQFHMNEGDLPSGGSSSPAVIVLLLYLSLTPAHVEAQLWSAPFPHTHFLPFCSWWSHQFSAPDAVPCLAAPAYSQGVHTDSPLNCSCAIRLALTDVTANLAFTSWRTNL